MNFGVPEYIPKLYKEFEVSNVALSFAETGRLQRAFCLFETYCHLFASCAPELDHERDICCDRRNMPSLENQAMHFLAKYSDYEIAELNCVRDYLFRRLRNMLNAMEDDMCKTARPLDFVFGQTSTRPLELVQRREIASGLWIFCNSFKRAHKEHIEHIISLGLPYIRRIFQSTGEERKSLLLRHIPSHIITHLERNFLTGALSYLKSMPKSSHKGLPLLPKHDPPLDIGKSGDTELGIPDAWHLAYPRAPPWKLVDAVYKGFRDWGFVFWDGERLRSVGLLGEK